MVGVVADHVDAVAFLPRGARPSKKLVGAHDFITPSLPTPVIARPTVWEASQRSYEEVLAAVDALEADASGRERRRRLLGVELLLAWLLGFPGESWQQRWLASGANTAGRRWADLLSGSDGQLASTTVRAQAKGAVGRLILTDVIRPGYEWLYRAPSWNLYARYEQVRDPGGFAKLTARCVADPRITSTDQRAALVQLCRILMHNGGLLADIGLGDCVEAYRAQSGYNLREHSHWYTLLREEAFLGSDSPPTIYAASRRGQLSIEEMVDGYDIACRPVRDLFVDYLHHRSPGLDYNTIRRLTSKLVLLFWRDLELHHPGINSLHLSDEVARGWKQRLQHVRYGNHRLGQERLDPSTNVVANHAHVFEWLALGIFKGPVVSFHTRDHRAFIPAAHRHQPCRILGQFGRQQTWHGRSQIDAGFVHRFDHHVVHARTRLCARRNCAGLVGIRKRVEEGRRHL